MLDESISQIREVDIYVELWRRHEFEFITNGERGHHKKQHQALELLIDNKTNHIFYGGAAGGSKEAPLDTQLLTPDGFIKLRDVKIGQDLLNPDGTIQKVIHLHPIHKSKQYVFKLSNGEEVVSHEGHLWYGGWRRDKRDYLASWDDPYCLKTSRQIYEHTLKESQKQKRRLFRIPIPQKVEFNQKGEIKLDPYFLGALIGNGTMTRKSDLKLTVYKDDLDHFLNILDVLDINYRYYLQKTKTCYDIVVKPKDRERIKSILKEYKILNCKAKTKFIPDEYKFTSRENRLNLLRGMLDTDGTIEKATGRVSYYTSSERLANDACWVARSLGFFSTVVKRPGREHYFEFDDRFINGSECYTVYIRSKNNKSLFKVERKKEGVKDDTKDYMSVGVLDVEIKEEVEMRCITVSNPNGLYIIDNFIVTHNSWTGVAWLFFMSLTYPGTRWFVGRNELKRLRQSTIPTVNKVAKQYGISKNDDFRFNGSDNFFLFKNGSRIDLLDLRFNPSDPLYERFGSIEYTGGWIEEAGEVDFLAFDVLKSRIGRHLNDFYGIIKKLFVTMNPKKNWLYTRAYQPWRKGKLPPNEQFIQCLVDDNPFRESDYINTLDDIEDKQLRERLRYGNWEYASDENDLCDYDAISDLFENSHVVPSRDYRVITADIALEGSDLLVLGVWYGLVLVDRVVVKKSDGKAVYLALDRLKIKYKVPNSRIVYDADGVGGFIAGFVKGSIAFHGGSSPLNKEKYKNLKAQMIYKLAQMINDRKVWFAKKLEAKEEEYIKAELTAQLKRAEADDERVLHVVKKADVKKDLGRSPDYVDMLMMRMYFEVNTKRPAKPRSIRVVN